MMTKKSDEKEVCPTCKDLVDLHLNNSMCKDITYILNYIESACDRMTSGNYMHHKSGIQHGVEQLRDKLNLK